MIRKGGLFSSEQPKTYVSHEEALASKKIHRILSSFLENVQKNRSIVVLCIGTDRSTGDSFGPLVGTQLHSMRLRHFSVYGTLSDPVHAVNMQEKIEEIHLSHDDPFIIAVDACLGRVKNVGSYQLGKGPLKPGAGVQKELPEVGDVHINGIVNVSGFMEYFVLQNTRLHLVVSMADILAESIYQLERSAFKQERFIPFQNISFQQYVDPKKQ
ncbi:spore protease YyaC [Bacillus gobiensis]|uniref:spore protease YyaC n=1 Tax=Bacillus gobiensis TaxID=1441095 RepID=UPI003D1FD4BF